MLFYTRHGKTDYNIKNLFCGETDVLINEIGKEQGKLTAEKLKDVKFDVIFCSPLKRAKQTLDYIIKYHEQTPVFFDDRIKERVHGVIEGVPVSSVDFVMWGIDDNKRLEGLESTLEVCRRVKCFYDEILPKYKNKNILVVAHGGIYRATVAYFEGMPENNNFSEMILDNCEIATFQN